MYKIILIFIILLFNNNIYVNAQQTITEPHECKLTQKAGEKLPKNVLENLKFEDYFYSLEIDSKLFQRINGLSYKKECTLPLSSLRYIRILHYDINNEILIGEMVCNVAISDDLLEIFRALFEAKYPIEKMLLVDEYLADDNASMQDNNSSSFNFRLISGTNRLSKHSLGMAIDINPRYNPYVREKNGKTTISPKESTKYINRELSFPYKIERNDACYKEFTKRGFRWGGNWTSIKDYQHFEK